KNMIGHELRQAAEYKQLLQGGQYFPNDYTLNLAKELRLLKIPGATLNGEQLLEIRKLVTSIEGLFRWFDTDRKEVYAALYGVVANSYYEKAILVLIDEVIDETGAVKDNASEELLRIRQQLAKKRSEQRRVFDRIIQKLSRSGMLTDTGEAFLNGR